MPKTLKEKEAELTENPLASELNFWDFDHEDRAIIYVDGSIGCGFKVDGVDNECDLDEDINQRTILIRSLLNSLPENCVFQMIYDVDSDFSEEIKEHHKKTPSSLINWISKNRFNRFKEEETHGLLYRPHIYFFFRFWPEEKNVKPLKFFQKQVKFSEDFKKKHQKMMRELFEKALDVESSFNALGLKARRLEIKEIKSLIYKFLNPERAQILKK